MHVIVFENTLSFLYINYLRNSMVNDSLPQFYKVGAPIYWSSTIFMFEQNTYCFALLINKHYCFQLRLHLIIRFSRAKKSTISLMSSVTSLGLLMLLGNSLLCVSRSH